MDANLLADRALCLQELMWARNLPSCEENPQTSLLWRLRGRERLMRKPNVADAVVDYCSFGTPYRARTRLRFSRCPPPRTLLHSRCKGRGICSFSHKPHICLTGGAGGKFMTAQKSKYPQGLAIVLARALSNAYITAIASKTWQLFSGGGTG